MDWDSRYLQEVMVELRDELVEVVSEVLAPLGLKRRSNSWYRAGKGVYAVVSL